LIFFDKKLYEEPIRLDSGLNPTMDNFSKSIGYNEYAVRIGSPVILWTLRYQASYSLEGATDVRKEV
jgi:hypothetical protein